MNSIMFRYVSVGLFMVIAANVWGDSTYMSPVRDGSVRFDGLASSPHLSSGHDSRQEPARKQFNEGSSPDYDTISDRSKFEPLVEKIARWYQLDSALLHAVISVESRYNPKALSPAGAAGLMQLMPATMRRYGVEDALDPEQNLRAGANYLKDLLSRFGSDIRLALAAYHAGETAVTRHQNTIPPFSSTIDFVSKVLEHYYKQRSISKH